jgi:hypothetical protein
MRTTLAFYLRLVVAWGALYLLFQALWHGIFGSRGEFIQILVLILFAGIVVVTGASHLRRVRLIEHDVDSNKLGNRHRRRIEVPLRAAEAFTLLEASVRELPNVDSVDAAKDSLQVRARLRLVNPYSGIDKDWRSVREGIGFDRNQVLATVTPGGYTSSVELLCEPAIGPWSDWFLLDDGTNLENANALTRAMARRISELRTTEEVAARETATEKELAVAKLGLLNAQVEPHFLYNTLGSAKYLVKRDPDKAEAMLDNLILYLRKSLPRTEDNCATLGDEVARVRAYLDILCFRMGARLTPHIDVDATLNNADFPSMMLQTLVENAIKHGLEPKSGGGNIWLRARRIEGSEGDYYTVTVADDGLGFNTQNQGTGIGLNNVRERLKLAYGTEATLTLVPNFPSGVAASIRLPLQHPKPTADQVGAS